MKIEKLLSISALTLSIALAGCEDNKKADEKPENVSQSQENTEAGESFSEKLSDTFKAGKQEVESLAHKASESAQEIAHETSEAVKGAADKAAHLLHEEAQETEEMHQKMESATDDHAVHEHHDASKHAAEALTDALKNMHNHDSTSSADEHQSEAQNSTSFSDENPSEAQDN